MLLPQGYGLRNTVDLSSIQYALDDLIAVHLHASRVAGARAGRHAPA